MIAMINIENKGERNSIKWTDENKKRKNVNFQCIFLLKTFTS